ncbi:hypothetical protein [Legionella oakridgensis]|nr:hypothetical protein [Legionella oakridgensis]
MLGWLFHYSHYGLDFTDESFYLIWITNPYQYKASVSQFGFIYHPLHQLLHGNVALLREANIAILFTLSFLLTNLLIKYFYAASPINTPQRWIISSGTATASFAFFQSWIATPSYNSLTLQALLMSSIALILIDKQTASATTDKPLNRIWSWIFLGTSGWLSVMAKPTTAVALAICSILYLFMIRKLHTRYLLLSAGIATGLLILSAWYIDSSIPAFMTRIKTGLEMTQILGSDSHNLKNLIRLDEFELSQNAKNLFTIIVITILCLVGFLNSRKQTLISFGIGLSLTIILLELAIILGIVHKNISIGNFQGLLLWSIPFAALLSGFFLCGYKYLSKISRSHWALAILFLLFPHLYAIGTGNNYWSHGSRAGIFWVLSGFILLVPIIENKKKPILLIPFVLATQFIVVVFINSSIEEPYRQPQPLRQNNYTFEIKEFATTLKLCDKDAIYLTKSKEILKNAHFKSGTPMIDLTGHSPGIPYLLGGINVGTPWMFGGYSGSDQFAKTALKKVSCKQLAHAWLLIEPEWPRNISSDILTSYGAELDKDFQIVGALKIAAGTGGLENSRTQYILKPTRPINEAISLCLATRSHEGDLFG